MCFLHKYSATEAEASAALVGDSGGGKDQGRRPTRPTSTTVCIHGLVGLVRQVFGRRRHHAQPQSRDGGRIAEDSCCCQLVVQMPPVFSAEESTPVCLADCRIR